MSAEPVLEAREIVKTYGHVRALRGASFSVAAGEVVALIGDNGAGKSTLIKCLSGTEHPDGGEIYFRGERITLSSPSDARDLGIETVYQDLALAPHLDPAANLFLGREIMKPGLLGRLGVLDSKAMQERTATAFADLGSGVQDSRASVGSMSGGQRQSVAVSRAATWATDVIILDEPTAALGVVQTERVLTLMRRIAESGIGVILISHSMPEVIQVADRIEVLRLGRRVAQFHARDTTMEELVGAMTGALSQELP